MTFKKYAAKKTLNLRKRLGLVPNLHTHEINVKTQLAASAQTRVQISLFIETHDEPIGAITSYGDFVISGWISTAFISRGQLALSQGAVDLECEAFPSLSNGKDKDVKGIESFQFTIPGYAWENPNPDGELEFQISAYGQPLNTQIIKLTEDILTEWLANTKKHGGQYHSLLAIEHLYHYRGAILLSNSLISYFTALAVEHKLPSFALSDPQKTLAWKDTSNDEKESDPVQVALKSLESFMASGSTGITHQIKSHISQYQLTKADRVKFLVFSIPHLCRKNIFDEATSELNLQEARSYLVKEWNNTNLSILTAFYAIDPSPSEVANALYAISENYEPKEWLHTDCIHFACVHSFNLMDRGLLKEDEFNDLSYAFLALLNACRKTSCPRLHDHLLVKTMASYLLRMHDASTCWLQRDLVAAAIKHYGLNPYFWEIINESDSSTLFFNSDFDEAQRKWKIVRSEFNKSSLTISNLAQALYFFDDHDNEEASHFMRMACIHEMAKSEPNISEINALNDILAKQNPQERLRLYAHPYSPVLDHPNQATCDLIWEGVRRKTGNAHISYYIQKQAAACMRNLTAACAEHDAGAIDAAYVELINFSRRLRKRRHAYLGLHLSAFAIARILPDTYNKSQIIDFLTNELLFISRHLEDNESMPAPLQSCMELIRKSDLSHQRTLMSLLTDLMNINDITEEEKINHGSELLMRTESSSLNGDTIVVVYSCHKYLNTRVQAIRDSWLKDVKARNIPYVILVGDGDDCLHGDILKLNVPDTYEKLPQKSLKLYEWIYQHTDAQYVLKIDDDCFLNVSEYFDSMSYRKHHYYGRILERQHSNMDRVWHQEKSNSKLSRSSLDKSPTPSRYADGGSSYTLSRHALKLLLQKSVTVEGQHLIQCSYMEDKLVGDLLSSAQIEPSGEDLSIYIRRRTFPDAFPVGMWENIFYPSKSLPAKVAHLDTDADMLTTYDRLNASGFWPKKIWSPFQDVFLRGYSNQLELLTQLNDCIRLSSEDFFVVSVLRNELLMLPHFLDHYRSIGVKAFIMVDNLSDDGSREYIMEQPDVILYSADTEYNKSHYGVVWQQAILGNHGLNKWALIADMDELLVFQDMEHQQLTTYLAQINETGYDCIRANMIDMYPSGDLHDADFTMGKPFDLAPYFDQDAIKSCHISHGIYSNHVAKVSGLRHRLNTDAPVDAYTSQKYPLIKYKPWMVFSEGLHDAKGMKVAPDPIYFAHFKYHAGFKEKALIEIERGQHYCNAIEYTRYLSLLAETEGNFYDKNCSIRYENSDSFKVTLNKSYE